MFRLQIEPDLHIELLHPVHAHDLYALVEKNRDHLREWLFWVDDTKGVEDIDAFIQMTMRQYADDASFQAAIFFDNRLVGVSGYKPINKMNRSGEIGYWLSRDCEGQGVMTKVNAALIEIGFENLDLNKIIIHCAVENLKSRAVAERLGFQEDGILRQHQWLNGRFVDCVEYSLLKSEYRAI